MSEPAAWVGAGQDWTGSTTLIKRGTLNILNEAQVWLEQNTNKIAKEIHKYNGKVPVRYKVARSPFPNFLLTGGHTYYQLLPAPYKLGAIFLLL